MTGEGTATGTAESMAIETAESVATGTAEITVTETVMNTKNGIKWIASDIPRGLATGLAPEVGNSTSLRQCFKQVKITKKYSSY